MFRRVPVPRCCRILQQIGGDRGNTVRTFHARGGRFCGLNSAYHPNSVLRRPPSVPSVGGNRFSTLRRGNSVLNIFMNRSRGGDFINQCGSVSLNFARSTNFGICNGHAGHNIHYFILRRSSPARCSACAHACRRLINAGIRHPIFSCLSDGTPTAVSTTVPVVMGAIIKLTMVITLVVLLTGLLWQEAVVDRGGGSGTFIH